MSLAPEESLPLPPPMARCGQIEIDTFCTGCHYNLHGQPVTLDERLGFTVCRCPECGRFHPAGVGVTASSIWLRRGATILLAAWVFSVLAVTFAFLFAMGGMSAGSVDAYTHGEQVLPDGTIVPDNPIIANQVGSAQLMQQQARYRSFLYPWFSNAGDNRRPPPMVIVIFSGVSLALGLAVGVLYVSLLWHWPWRRYFVLGLLPLLPMAFLWVIYSNTVDYEFVRGECRVRIAIETGIQVIGIFIGVLCGRRVARALVRAVIPPKPRQALAFLWVVDGKTLPG